MSPIHLVPYTSFASLGYATSGIIYYYNFNGSCNVASLLHFNNKYLYSLLRYTCSAHNSYSSLTANA